MQKKDIIQNGINKWIVLLSENNQQVVGKGIGCR